MRLAKIKPPPPWGVSRETPVLNGFLPKTQGDGIFFSPLFAEGSRNKTPSSNGKTKKKSFLGEILGCRVFIYLSDNRFSQNRHPTPMGVCARSPCRDVFFLREKSFKPQRPAIQNVISCIPSIIIRKNTQLFFDLNCPPLLS